MKKLNFTGSKESFASNRALADYIGVNVRPDMCASLQLIAPGKEAPSKKEMKLLGNTIDFLNETRNQGHEYEKVIMDTAQIVLLRDASFANSRGVKIQLG